MMAPTLPSSLSPHVCVLASTDLQQLLHASSLPPLEDILQSFSPLPQVTTRTTSLVTVPHSSFALRFSSLVDIEAASQEDEEKRATRTIDWIGGRINRGCAKWVEAMEKKPGRDNLRPPWWDELRRCSEGDHVPSKTEGWNHPVSIIIAVSTTAPNPLQAITTLHSRTLEFPSWVDSTHLVYTLIVHPQNSALSDEEAGALFNAVKKQHGLHVYLLPLSLPSPPPAPVVVAPLPPRLPPPSDDAETDFHDQTMAALSDTEEVFDTRPNTLRMSEQDLQQTARFTREFVVMNLVPWMERCVIEWNEAYSSSRRLPSRLFSSTRRLFGSGTSTPQTPVHGSSTSISSLPTRSHTYSASQTSSSGPNIPPPSQQRRLAEFATILGDFKLAVGIWESLRKEGKGGSDVLPMLLSASPAITSHVTQALSSIHPSASELPPQAQLQALRYSVRWETSIVPSDFISDVLEGERWLVWAAGNAEEAPSALLLAYAALLSVRKEARRRAALWYFFSASKLQKCGIKPLAMYFLRRAHEILNARSEKLLSPSFWDSEGNTPSWQAAFGAAISGIEHPLGRLLYSTGDTRGAIQLFLALLRWSSTHSSGMNDEVGDGQDSIGTTKVYLEDFMAALSHLTSMSDEGAHLSDLTLPIKFSLPASSRLQLRRDPIGGEESEWERKEEVWRSFWMGRGRETLEKSGKAVVGESFWFSLTLHNPLDTEVTLANVSLAVEAKGFDRDSLSKIVQVECLDKVTLFPNENRVVSFTLKPFEAATLNITHLRYEFLGLLPAKESLARRGRRMQDTLQQRLTATYAPDILSKVEVEDANLELDVSFETNEPLTVLDGESKQVKVWISNAGSKAIGEVWMLAGSGDQISLDNVADEVPRGLAKDIHTDNRLLQWSPYCLPLDQELHSSDTTEVLFTWRPISTSNGRLCLLFIYRETGGRTFHCTRVIKNYEIYPCLSASVNSRITPVKPHPFLVDVEIFNSAAIPMRVTQVTTVSPVWQCQVIAHPLVEPLQPNQSANFLLTVWPSEDRSCLEKTQSFVSRKLGDILNGCEIEAENPPPLVLICSHASTDKIHDPYFDSAISRLYICERGSLVANSIARSHPHIPTSLHSKIFPLYNPLSLDILVFWETPSEQRRGFMLIPPITLGATHGALRDIVQGIEQTKAKRSMYAETQREKTDILQAIRDSEWNAECNPLVVTVEDGLIVEHDFNKGGCFVHVAFTIKNYSLTHPSRYVLRFDPSLSQDATAESADGLPRYVGPLTVRGALSPSDSSVIRTCLWVNRPGTYVPSGWKIEVEVGEPQHEGSGEVPWRTGCRYVQGPPANYRSRFTVNPVSKTHPYSTISE